MLGYLQYLQYCTRYLQYMLWYYPSLTTYPGKAAVRRGRDARSGSGRRLPSVTDFMICRTEEGRRQVKYSVLTWRRLAVVPIHRREDLAGGIWEKPGLWMAPRESRPKDMARRKNPKKSPMKGWAGTLIPGYAASSGREWLDIR